MSQNYYKESSLICPMIFMIFYYIPLDIYHFGTSFIYCHCFWQAQTNLSEAHEHSVGVLKIGSFSTPYLCTDSCSHPSGKACRRQLETDARYQEDIQSMIRRRKTEGWVPVKTLAGEASPRQGIGPGKIPRAARHRTRQSSARPRARQGAASGTVPPLQRSDEPVI